MMKKMKKVWPKHRKSFLVFAPLIFMLFGTLNAQVCETVNLDFGSTDGTFSFPTVGGGDITNEATSGANLMNNASFDIIDESGMAPTTGTDGTNDIQFDFSMTGGSDPYGGIVLDPLGGTTDDVQQSTSGIRGNIRFNQSGTVQFSTGDVHCYAIEVTLPGNLAADASTFNVFLNSVNTCGEVYESTSVVFIDETGAPYGTANYTGFYGSALGGSPPTGVPGGSNPPTAASSAWTTTGTGVYIADIPTLDYTTDIFNPECNAADPPTDGADPNAATDGGLNPTDLVSGFVYTVCYEDITATANDGDETTANTQFTSTLNGMSFDVCGPEPEGCVSQTGVCEGDDVTAIKTGGTIGTAGYNTIYYLVNENATTVVAAVDTDGLATFAAPAVGCYQIHVLNYDEADAPTAAADLTTVTDISAINDGCYNANLLTDFSCICVNPSDEKCEGDPFVVNSAGSTPGNTQIYILTDGSGTTIINTIVDPDINVATDVDFAPLTPGDYQVFALNYPTTDVPSFLAQIVTGGTMPDQATLDAATGCFNDNLLSDFICCTVNPLPIANDATLALCDDGSGMASFTLADAEDATATSNTASGAGEDVDGGATGVTVTYYDTQANADAGMATGLLTTLSAADGTTVIVRVQNDMTGCYETAVVALNVLPLPVVSITDPGELCAADPATTIVGSPAGGTFTATAYIDAAGSFDPAQANIDGLSSVTYSYTDANGCMATATIDVSVVTCVCEPTDICQGTDIVAVSSGGTAGNLQWYFLVPDGTTAAVTANTTGTFSTTGLTGIYNVHALNFDPNNPPAPLNAAPYSMPVVDGEITNATTLDLGTLTGGCFNANVLSDRVCFDILPLPTVDLGTDVVQCVGTGDVTLDAGAGFAAYSWSPGGETTQTIVITDAAMAQTTYSVTVTDANGCMNTDMVDVTINALAVVSITDPGEFCSEDFPITIVGSPAGGTFTATAYIDAAGNFDPAQATIDGLSSVAYSYTDANGCTATATIDVSVVTCTCTPTDICIGTDIVAVSSGGTAGNLQWYFLVPDGTTAAVAANTTGTFSTTGLTGIYNVHALNFDPNDPPAPLNAAPYGMPVVDGDITNATTLDLGTLTGGCFNGNVISDRVCFNILALPIVDLGADIVQCVGTGDVTLDAGAGFAAYSWGPGGETTQTITITDAAMAQTTYSVAVTDANGCVSTIDMVDVTINLLPTISAVGSNPTTCGGSDGSIALTFTNLASGTYTINYAGGGSFTNVSVSSSGMATITGLAMGTYNDLVITNENGCSSINDVDIMLSDPDFPPTPTAVGDVYCDGDAIVPITATGDAGATFSWFTDAAMATPATGVSGGNNETWTPSGAIGTETVYVFQTVAGCTSNSTQVDVTVNPLPVVDLGTDIVQCVGTGGVTLDAGAGFAAYSWNPGGETTQIITITDAAMAQTTYSVTVTDVNGCVNSASTNIVVETCYTPGIAVSKDDATPGDPDSDGDDSQTVPVGGDATFTITISNTGDEPLCNISIADMASDAALDVTTCQPTFASIDTDNGAVAAGMGDGILGVGETETIVCTVNGMAVDFTNSITINAEGCITGGGVMDTDDTEVIVLPFDLAMTKTTIGFNDNDGSGVVSPGDGVIFGINVFNQGGFDAYDIGVIDYFPAGDLIYVNSSLSPTSSATPVVTDNGLNGFEIDFLTAGEEAQVLVEFIIDPNFVGATIMNTAEITTAALQDNGPMAPDEDNPLGSGPRTGEGDDELDDESVGGVDDPEDNDAFDPEGIEIGCGICPSIPEIERVCAGNMLYVVDGNNPINPVPSTPGTIYSWYLLDNAGNWELVGTINEQPYFSPQTPGTYSVGVFVGGNCSCLAEGTIVYEVQEVIDCTDCD